MRSVLVPAALLRGAIRCLLIATPAVVVIAWMANDSGSTEQSNWVYLSLLAIIVAYLVGGAGAGAWAPDSPFTNGAVAVFGAFVIVQGIALMINFIRGDSISIISFIFNGLLAASIGAVGAGIGIWRGTLDTGDGESAR